MVSWFYNEINVVIIRVILLKVVVFLVLKESKRMCDKVVIEEGNDEIFEL